MYLLTCSTDFSQSFHVRFFYFNKVKTFVAQWNYEISFSGMPAKIMRLCGLWHKPLTVRYSSRVPPTSITYFEIYCREQIYVRGDAIHVFPL